MCFFLDQLVPLLYFSFHLGHLVVMRLFSSGTHGGAEIVFVTMYFALVITEAHLGKCKFVFPELTHSALENFLTGTSFKNEFKIKTCWHLKVIP